MRTITIWCITTTSSSFIPCHYYFHPSIWQHHGLLSLHAMTGILIFPSVQGLTLLRCLHGCYEILGTLLIWLRCIIAKYHCHQDAAFCKRYKSNYARTDRLSVSWGRQFSLVGQHRQEPWDTARNNVSLRLFTIHLSYQFAIWITQGKGSPALLPKIMHILIQQHHVLLYNNIIILLGWMYLNRVFHSVNEWHEQKKLTFN